MFEQLFSNQALLSSLIAWFVSGLMKVPIEYFETHKWNWSLWFSSGGMPSSHSALVTANMLSVGLWAGFDTAAFAVSFTLMMVVVYDAAGVRRQAGYHAQKINLLIEELFSGQPISEDELKEVLGHTPREVIAGCLFGALVAVVVWLLW